MAFFLLLLFTLTIGQNPTEPPTPIYWQRVSCADGAGTIDCLYKKGPKVGPGPLGPIDVECDSDDPEDCVCADYWGRYPDPQDQHWIMALASIFALCMAFGIGANDAANSWASSVGSKAITVGWAVILCGFFEWAGATSIGYGVSKTIQKGVSKITADDCWACGNCDSEVTLMMGGSLGALIGASLFLLLASGTAVPVSTTHSIVGGVVGMTLAGAGTHCLNWKIDGGLSGIILSWIISPVLSGVIASTGYTLSLRFLINVKNARYRSLCAVPFLYGIMTFACFMMIFLKAKAIKKKFDLPTKFWVSGLIGAAVIVFVWVFLKPVVEKNLPSETGETDLYLNTGGDLEKGKPRIKGQGSQTEVVFDSPRAIQAADNVEMTTATKSDQYQGSTEDALSPSVKTLASDPDTTPLKDWDVPTTLKWLSEGNNGRFKHLTDTWQKHLVDGEALMLVTEDELRTEIGVERLGDRKAMMNAINALKEKNESEAFTALVHGTDELLDAENGDQLDALFVFRYLIVFTACLESFAHGSNDTANATGPFSAVYQLYVNGGKDCSSDEGVVWIMCVAGIMVAVGVGTFGYRVIKTIGENLTMLDFHKGFYIEVGSVLATMIATVLEMPVSTTHCQVGAVIGVGMVARFNGKGQVAWPLFGKIFATWVLTLPIAGGGSAIVVAIIKGVLIRPDSCA